MVVKRVLRSRPMRDFGLMTIGILLTAWALDAFLIPNKIAAGGISGLATIIYHTLKPTGVVLGVGFQMLVMNAVLLAIGVKSRGIDYLAKTVYGMVALSVAIELLARYAPAIAGDDLLLSSLYGGAITGLGLGMVFKAGGNTGGTDIIAQLLAVRHPFGVGQIMFVIDALVTLLAAFAFGPTLALYGAVSIVVSSLVIDLVLDGLSVERAVFIISDQIDRISAAVTQEMGRGATRIKALGAYTGEARGMLFVVLSRNEIDDLKEIVATIDPSAMVIISKVHETLGEGFKEMRMR